MRNLEVREIQVVNGGDLECAVAVGTFVLSVASVFVAPATGGASLLVSQAAIVGSSVSMGLSCGPDSPGNPGSNNQPGQGGDRKPE